MEIKVIMLVMCLSWCGAEQRDSPQHRSTPEYIVLGTRSGQIWRCLLHGPPDCELYYNGTSPVLDTLVHGEILVFSNDKGEIFKCNWQKQCTVFYRGYALRNLAHLAAAGEFLYAGGDSHVLLRCNLHIPHSCLDVYMADTWIRGIYHNDKYIYVCLDHGLLLCSNDFEFNCQPLAAGISRMKTTSVSGWGDVIFISSTPSFLYAYNSTSKYLVTSLGIQLDDLFKMATFKGYIYFIYIDSHKHSIAISKWDDININTHIHIVEYELYGYTLTSMAFVYATHHMQRSLDGDSCSQGSLSTVFNYQEEQRAMMEVSVAGGKLVDARGAPVDTRLADAGYSGPAAVFAMALGGQILASNAHRSGLVHITSFFAGEPVAGAGEMIVEDGVIKRIVACSQHYWADVELNRQVVHELYSRGYARAWEIKLEECEYMCDRLTT